MNPQLGAALLVGAGVLWIGICLGPRPVRRFPTAPANSADGAGSPRARLVHGLVRRRRRLVIRPDDVAAWCDDLARRVRSGSSLAGALSEAIPAAPSLHVATDPIRLAIARGRPVAEAVAIHGAPTPVVGSAHLGAARSVIAVAAALGGSSAAPLDRVAAALRLRAVDGQERAAHSAQALLSAHVMTVVPLLMLGVLLAVDPDVRAAIARPIGASCVSLGMALNLTGWVWMRRTIGRPR